MGDVVDKHHSTKDSEHFLYFYGMLLSKFRMINLDSAFQKRMVMNDFNKNFFDELHESESDYLIIDFIDERFDLLNLKGSFVTRSNELINSRFTEDSTIKYKLIRRNDKKTHRLWEKSCLEFIEKIKALFPLDRVILHESYWTYHYFDDDNKLVKFPQKSYINKMNRMLKQYYTFFKNNTIGIHVVSGAGYGDKNHKWGLSPFHFNIDYYESILSKINGKVASDSKAKVEANR